MQNKQWNKYPSKKFNKYLKENTIYLKDIVNVLTHKVFINIEILINHIDYLVIHTVVYK